MAKRETHGDLWRGFAVVLMLGANLAGSSLLAPHPPLLRFLFSLPAPIFIGLAGFYSVRQSAQKLFFRGAILLFWAVIIDLFGWNIGAFQEWDVLYVLGIGLWISIPFNQPWGNPIAILVGLACAISFGFPHLFHQGWFPPLPWLLIFLLGRFRNEFPRVAAWGTIGLLGSLYLWAFPPNTRLGYSEWYYPISVFSLAFATGVVGTITAFPRLIPQFSWLKRLGQNSLWVYVGSSFIIAWGSSRWIHGWKFSLFAFLWLLLVVFFAFFIFPPSKKDHG